MDVLVSQALQEVAAEGSQGCSLSTLWSSLHRPAVASGLPLDHAVKQALWKSILATPCLTFQGPAGPSSPAILSTDPSIQLHTDAEQVGIRIMGSEQLRESYLGAYDFKHSDSRLSVEQKMILERVGKARADGITQFELGKEFGMSGKKLFYIIKNLESRGLLVRQSSIFRVGPRPVATNLVHLKCYAKERKLGFQQRYEIQDYGSDYGIKVSDISNSTEISQDSITKDLRINDDLPALRAICAKLEDSDEKVLVVSDLKISLGYRFKKGHRTWRRLLARLTSAGLVEAFDAKIGQKVLSCIRLVKPFDPKAFSLKYSSLSSEEGGTDQSFKGAKRGQLTDQVAELSLDRQIYDYIRQGGSDGVPVTEIFTRLGINNRKNYQRLTEMIPLHGLRLEAENYKRSTKYRVWAPEAAIIDKHEMPSRIGRQSADTSVDAEDISPASRKSPLLQDAPSSRKVNVLDANQLYSEHNSETDSRVAASMEISDVTEDELPMTGPEVLPYDDPQNMKLKDRHDVLSDASDLKGQVSVSKESLTVSFSSGPQRRMALSSAHSQRELWIMERLEREGFVTRGELHRWLEELEDRKDTFLDRKTVLRNLQKLQKEGRCKCLLVSLPGVTNCGQFRTVEVILLPSLEVGPELLNKIYERQRAFDIQIRSHSAVRNRKHRPGVDVPDLTGLKRMPPTEAQVVDKGGTLQDNGFIIAKMVRCRMLHHFLWGYVSNFSDASGMVDENDAVGDVSSSSSGQGMFSLLVAVQSMPLELFLQVIGTTKHIKGLAECCRRGMRLSDLPTRESAALLDANASGRLSWLVDILRRLKLLRIVMIPSSVEDSIGKVSQASVTYALEQRPYIDEPAPEPPASLSTHVMQLGPSPRHYFTLSSKESLDKYWKSLEYYFSGRQSYISRRAFPGSTVPELFGPRSWSSVRVMTLEQRTQLQKRVLENDSRRLPYEECVQIARELDLSLDQVLRVSYEKNQKARLQERHILMDETLGSSRIDIAMGARNLSLSKKRPASCEGLLETASLQISKRKHHWGTDNVSPEKIEKETENHVEADEGRDEVDAGNIHIVKKFRPLRGKKFKWRSSSERVLIACYTRQRAIVGARYNRVDWSLIQGLPAAPETCRRRMALLKLIPEARKAMMTLCNILAARYTKYLRSQYMRNSQDKCQYSSQVLDATFNGGFAWDNFDDPSLSTALDAVIQCKNFPRASSVKKMVESPFIQPRNSKAAGHDSGENKLASNDPTSVLQNKSRPANVTEILEGQIMSSSSSEQFPAYQRSVGGNRARPTRVQTRKKLLSLTTLKDVSSSEIVRKSVGAAVAVELIKLVFLNSAVESEISNVLVDALRRCRESDIFTAFRFLKDRGMVAVQQESRAFVLSPIFYQSVGASYFSAMTSAESKKFQNWVEEQKKNLEQDWVLIKPDKEWGELFQLFAAVLSGELSILPFMPEKGIGERDHDELARKRKRDMSDYVKEVLTPKPKFGGTEEGGITQRRERGFPGIEVKAHIVSIPLEKMLSLDSVENTSLEYAESGHVSPAASTVDLDSEPESLVSVSCCETSKQSLNSQSLSETQISYGVEFCEDLGTSWKIFDKSLIDTLYEAVSLAGEEGLAMDELADKVRQLGGGASVDSEGASQALHSIGLAREVMAYDHTRIISNSHNQHFFLHVARPAASSFDIIGAQDHMDLASKKGFDLKPDPVHCSTVTINKDAGVSQRIELQSPMEKGHNEEHNPVDLVPILPWLEADGKENIPMRKALNRRIMGIVMLRPGISEGSIVEQVNVLNPTSCQKLLQLLVLEGHLIVRTWMRSEAAAPPLLLQSMIKQKPASLICRKHYYANPSSSSLL